MQGKNASDFQARYEGGDLKFRVKSNNVELEAEKESFGGKFRGLLDIRDDFVPDLDSDIEHLAYRLVTEVNAQHQAGYGLDGQNGRSFFTMQPSYQSDTGFADPEALEFGTGSIDVNGVAVDIDPGENSLNGIRDAINGADAGVVASIVYDGGDYHLNLTPLEKAGPADFDPDLTGGTLEFIDEDGDSEFFGAVGSEDISVAISSTREVAAAGVTAGEPGDNENALAIHELGASQLINGDHTFVDSYGKIASEVGTETRRNRMAARGAGDTMDQLENLRDSISGVSLEEEMMDLTRFQRGFEASSRFVQTIDEMMATIIGLKR